jgi:hypothetical protein
MDYNQTIRCCCCYYYYLNGAEDHNVKQNKLDSGRQTLHVFSHAESRPKKTQNGMNAKGGLLGKDQ